MREVCLGLAEVTAAANARGGCLMDRAFDTGPDCVALFPLLSGLCSAGLLHDLVYLAGPEHELAAGAGGGGALRTHRTPLTCRGGKAHHDRFSATFGAGRPDRVGHALWAGHAVVVPIDGERSAVETAPSPSLRRVVEAQRAQQRGTELAPGADHQLGGGVAGIHDVLVR